MKKMEISRERLGNVFSPTQKKKGFRGVFFFFLPRSRDAGVSIWKMKNIAFGNLEMGKESS